MKFLAVLLISATAFAAKPQPDYQDGIFRGLHVSQVGTRCQSYGDTNGTVQANTDTAGSTNGTLNASTTTSTSCSPRMRYEYTVLVGQQLLVLTPKESIGSALVPGIAMAFHKNSTLAGKLPGEQIQLRSEGGTIYVKSGKRESAYVMIGAQ